MAFDTCATSKRLIVLGMAATLQLACGGGSDVGSAPDGGTSVTCGEGTTKQGNACVVSTTNAPDSGASQAALECGAGTIKKDGTCIPDPAGVVVCGEGTMNTDGQCVANVPLVTISKLQVTHLAFTLRGQVLDGSDGNNTITEFYPLDIDVGVTYSGDAVSLPVTIALEPASASDPDPARGCILTGLAIEHPGGQDPTEATAHVTLDVPDGCLKEGEDARKLVPRVLVDPSRTLNAKDPDTVSVSVAFSGPQKDEDASNHCHRGSESDAPTGDCGPELNLVSSPGLDFELADLSVESSVLLVDKCGSVPPHSLSDQEWATWVNDPSSIDTQRPPAYRCNSQILPEFKIKMKDSATGPVPDLDADGRTQLDLDADGNPQLATVEIDGVTYLSFLYGDADMVLNAKVLTHGETSSDVTSADEAAQLGDDPVAHNALQDDNLEMRYHFRPSSSDSDADWRPLFLHAKGDQAKADGPTMSGQERVTFEETVAVPATPTYYSHGLYLENDCGEKNLATCDPNLNPRDELTYGVWADETNFTVRACLVTVDLSGVDAPALDQFPDNNCRYLEIRAVRRAGSGSQNATNSLSYDSEWKRGSGDSDTIHIAMHAFTHNTLDKGGAESDNYMHVVLASDLLGDRDLTEIRYTASVDVAGMSKSEVKYYAMGEQIEHHVQTSPALHVEATWGVSKEKKKKKTFHPGGFELTARAKVYGSAGVTVSGDLTSVLAKNASADLAKKAASLKVPDDQRIGFATLTVDPNSHIKASASMEFDALVVKAGVKGSFTLYDVHIPARIHLLYGIESLLQPFQMNTAVWADQALHIDAMHGKMYVYAEKLNWSGHYKKFWSRTLVHFSGWEYDQVLWDTPVLNKTITIN